MKLHFLNLCDHHFGQKIAFVDREKKFTTKIYVAALETILEDYINQGT